jgi:hypothetical protein
LEALAAEVGAAERLEARRACSCAVCRCVLDDLGSVH